jgi:DNA repair exonuclease SbcCD nuclease subunit
MKIALIGDTHFGKKGFSEKFYKNQINFFKKQFFPYLKKHKIDFVIQLGDLFDNRKIIDLKFFQDFITDFKKLLDDWNGKFIVLTGNHDIYYKNTRAYSILNILKEILPIDYYNEQTLIEINNKKLGIIPWLIGKEKIQEKFLDCDYLFGHFEFIDFEVVQGVENHYGIDYKKLPFKGKKIFSGHFHLKQEKDKIHYIGTPYQLDWNDCGDNKGFYILDLKNDKLEFIENKISKKFIKIFLGKTIYGTEKDLSLKNLKNNEIKIYLIEDRQENWEFINSLKEENIEFIFLDKTFKLDIETNEENIKSPKKLLLDNVKDKELQKLLKELFDEAQRQMKV